MNFEKELQILQMQIKTAEDVDELDYLRRTNEKKYWWTNIFFCGLFYGLNGKVVRKRDRKVLLKNEFNNYHIVSICSVHDYDGVHWCSFFKEKFKR